MKRKLTVPGYNYLGPNFNDDNPGEPVNKLDRIAQTHDREYGEAKTGSDVDLADERFENEAWKEGVLGNAAAATIRLKSAVERNVFGQHLYPFKSYGKGGMAPPGKNKKKAPSPERSRSPARGAPDTPPETPSKDARGSHKAPEESEAMDTGADAMVGVGASSSGVAGGSAPMALKHLGLPGYRVSKTYPASFRYNRTRNMILTQNVRAVGPQICFLQNFGSRQFRDFVSNNYETIRRCDTLFLHNNTLKIDARQNMQAHVIANSFDLQTREGNIGSYSHLHLGAYGMPAHTLSLGIKDSTFMKNFITYKKLKADAASEGGYQDAQKWLIQGWDEDFWTTAETNGAETKGCPILFGLPPGQAILNSDYETEVVPWASDPLKHLDGPYIGWAQDIDDDILVTPDGYQMSTDNPWLHELGTHDNMVNSGTQADPVPWPKVTPPAQLVGTGGTPLRNMADWMQGLRHPDVQEVGRNYPKWKTMVKSTKEPAIQSQTDHMNYLQAQGIYNQDILPGTSGGGQDGRFWGHKIGPVFLETGGRHKDDDSPTSRQFIRGGLVPYQAKTGGQRPLETWTPVLRDNTPQGFVEGDGGQPMDFDLPNKVRLPLRAVFLHFFFNVETWEDGNPSSTSHLMLTVSCIIPTNSPEIPWALCPLRNKDGTPTKQNWRNLDFKATGTPKQYPGMMNNYWKCITLPPWIGAMGERNIGSTTIPSQRPQQLYSGFAHYTPPSFLNPGATTKDNGVTMKYNTTGPELYYDFIGAPATYDITGKKLLGEYQNFRAQRTLAVDFHQTAGDRFATANDFDEFKMLADYPDGHGKGHEIWPLRVWIDGQTNEASNGTGYTPWNENKDVDIVLPL